jgi:glycosyltransferase involved in cell wall biosynthesis
MYLIAIHVPIYTDGSRTLVASDWRRDLIMLRDSLQNRFGQLLVIAPSIPIATARIEQLLEEVTEANDGIRLVPSFPLNSRARDYWFRYRKVWLSALREHVAKSQVVHAGLDDLYRPISFDGFREALRQNKPTVFVQDTDIAMQHRELTANAGWIQRIKSIAYSKLFERWVRWSVARADLSLLKGSTLTSRYGRFAKYAREFQHTMHSIRDVIDEAELESRLKSSAGPLRFVYCGRWVPRKGLERSIKLVALVRALGVDVEFDLIGDGPCRADLESQLVAAGLNGKARLCGSVLYGPELLKRLSTYDAMLFTPTAEDTPRMIFDGYAAGLPLVAGTIAYTRERAESERATVLLPDDDREASRVIVDLARDRNRLSILTRNARRAGVESAFENWFRRRADWTFEAVERHRTC